MSVLHRLFLACVTVLLSAGATAAQTGAPLPPDQAFSLSVSRQADGDLSFAWTIASGYYMYRDHTRAMADGASLPLVLSRGESVDDPDFGVVDVWRDQGRAVVPAHAIGDPGAASIRLTYQGCLEGSLCYPPTTRTVPVPARPVGTPAPTPTPAPVPASTVIAAPPPAAEPLPVAAAAPAAAAEPPAPLAVAAAPVARGGLIDRLAVKGGAAWVLAAFFGFGVLLAFTPCVFPMYPILAGVIGRGLEGRGSRRGLVLSSAYVLGLSTALALLGVVAAWSGQNLQMALQSPWAVGAVAAIFALLALSMFGLFDLQLPSLWTSRLSRDGGHDPHGKTGRRSVPSAAGLGFVSALIVGPCVTAPLAGALLYIAQTGDLALGGLALFVLGLGKGLPLIAFGTAGARFLPRAGPWMDRIKTAFGFVFLAMAWWLAARILPPPATLMSGAALALGLASALGLFRSAATGPLGGLARAAGLAAAAWGVLLLIGLSLGADDPWRPLAPLSRPASVASAPVQPAAVVRDQSGLERALAQASAGGRPALAYVYADWCVSCRAMERRVFQNPAVVDRLSAVDLVKVDVTQDTPPVRELMQRHGVVGPPTLIFFAPSGAEAPDARIVGVTSVRRMLEALDQAGAAA